MRLIKMTGGLGNQMFIYAFYLRMKKRWPEVRIDLSDMVHYHAHHGYEMHRVFALPRTEFCINRPLKKVVEFLFFKKVYERYLPKDGPAVWERHWRWPLIYFKGFWQSERYFTDIEDEVCRTFTFDTRQASERTLQMAATIDADAHAVSLHVRRGDYLLPKFYASSGCVCRISYYRNAVAEMLRRMPEAHFYVFSDDIEWVRANLPLPRADYVDWNTGVDSWQDMMLMSRCRHNIICNSTFSWWGAWLNAHPDKVVVAPDHWYAGDEHPAIVPDGWVKVSTE